MEFSQHLEDLIKLEAYIQTRVKLNIQPPDPYESAETAMLNEAFAKAQGEYPRIYPNKQDQFKLADFNDLDSTLVEIRPILSKYGLAIHQYTVLDTKEGSRVLHTRLRHSSGQWCETREKIIPHKDDDFTYASTLMFKKRHQLMTLLNLTMAEDRYDDNAQVAMENSRNDLIRGTALNAKYNPRDLPSQTISESEYDQIDQILSIPECRDLGEEILTSLKIRTIQDMPKAKFPAVMEQLRKRKMMRDGTLKI